MKKTVGWIILLIIIPYIIAGVIDYYRKIFPVRLLSIGLNFFAIFIFIAFIVYIKFYKDKQ